MTLAVRVPNARVSSGPAGPHHHYRRVLKTVPAYVRLDWRHHLCSPHGALLTGKWEYYKESL